MPQSLSDLTPDPANRRTHTPRNLAMLTDALRVVGASRSIVIDEAGVILAGNGVVEAASAAGLTKVQVVDGDGDTVIAVRRSNLSPEQKRALALYDNRTAELAEWNVDQLAADLQSGADLTAFFADDELHALLATGPKAGKTDPDDVPAVRATDIQRGDLFELGRHRLLCGDATAKTDVALVIGSDHPGLMNTDPPYGVDYSKLKDGIPGSGFSDHQERWGDIENDTLTDGASLQVFLEAAIRTAVPFLLDNTAFYLWHPMLTQGTFFAAAAAAAADILIHRQIIWKKPGFVLTRSGMYHWAHELCFFGWRRGYQPPWYGPKNQTSVWELGRDTDHGQHPTQKPVALFLPPITNHTSEGAAIYEPFAGSGSQFIAAEQTSRRSLGLEIEPLYVQVAIDRWEAFTGQTAQKVGEAIRT